MISPSMMRDERSLPRISANTPALHASLSRSLPSGSALRPQIRRRERQRASAYIIGQQICIALVKANRGVRAARAFEALDLRPPHQQTFHPQRKPAQAQRPRRLRRLLVWCRVRCLSGKAREISAGDSRRYSGNRHERIPADRFRSFTYEELTKRDKLNLDIFWLKDASLKDSANLPDPHIISAEIVKDLEAALQQFAAIATDLNR